MTSAVLSLIPKSIPSDGRFKWLGHDFAGRALTPSLSAAGLHRSPLIVRSFTCIPELRYCSAERIGMRHDCDEAKRQAWIHDPGDED